MENNSTTNFTKLVVKYAENNNSNELNEVAFIGRWLVETVREDTEKITGNEYSVAINADNNFFVFYKKVGTSKFYAYKIYESFEVMADSDEVPAGILSTITLSLIWNKKTF